MLNIFTIGIAHVGERHRAPVGQTMAPLASAPGRSVNNVCRKVCLLLTAALLAAPLVPGQSKAASPRKCVRETCKVLKRSCIKQFKAEFKEAKLACKEAQKPGECRKAKKKEFKQNRKACTGGFTSCKTCCETDKVGCSLANCGDGVMVAGEGCDDGNNVDGDGCSAQCEIEDEELIACISDCRSVNHACYSPAKREYKAARAACKAELISAKAAYKTEREQCERDERTAKTRCEEGPKRTLKDCLKDAEQMFRECKKDAHEAYKDAKGLYGQCVAGAKVIYRTIYRATRDRCFDEYKVCKSCCKNDLPQCASVPRTFCPPNEAGGPNLLTLTVVDGGDLDVGWTGIGHNQGAVIGAQVYACLQSCDTYTNPVCTGTGTVGEGSLNGTAVGPPLPMLAADVATCVINEFTEDITIRTLNLETGEIEMRAKLKSVVHLTGYKTSPCPTCSGKTIGATGRCEGLTPSLGKSCTTQGITEKLGNTSSDCLPFEVDNVGELAIVIDSITSATATLPATNECRGGLCPCAPPDFPLSVLLLMNECDDPNDCTPENCPSDPMTGGSQPGIDQACCKSRSQIIPCFFVGAISRTGEAVPPQPLWPDPGYPKIAEGGKIASAFCIPPTNSSIINGVYGIGYGVGGPGAFVLPVDTYVEFSP